MLYDILVIRKRRVLGMERYEQSKERPIHERKFADFLELIEGKNAGAVKSFLENEQNAYRIDTAPGSRGAHHGWGGGYKEHIRQTMVIVTANFELFQGMGAMRLSLSRSYRAVYRAID